MKRIPLVTFGMGRGTGLAAGLLVWCDFGACCNILILLYKKCFPVAFFKLPSALTECLKMWHEKKPIIFIMADADQAIP